MLEKYILLLILFIFVFNVISKLTKIWKEIFLLELDNIKIKIDLAKKLNKTYFIDPKKINIYNNTICIKSQCIKVSKNITIKGGTLYV